MSKPEEKEQSALLIATIRAADGQSMGDIANNKNKANSHQPFSY